MLIHVLGLLYLTANPLVTQAASPLSSKLLRLYARHEEFPPLNGQKVENSESPLNTLTRRQEGQGFKGIFIDPKSLSDKGDCQKPTVRAGFGINGRKKTELTFIPDSSKEYAHGEAKNLAIITQSICDKMLNCGAKEKKEIFENCKKLSKEVGSSADKAAGADNWNKGFGLGGKGEGAQTQEEEEETKKTQQEGKKDQDKKEKDKKEKKDG